MADHFSPVLYVFGALYRLAATPGLVLRRPGGRARRHGAARCGRSRGTSASPPVAATLPRGAEQPAPRRGAVRLPPEHPGGAVPGRRRSCSRCRTGRRRRPLAAVGRGAVPGRPGPRARSPIALVAGPRARVAARVVVARGRRRGQRRGARALRRHERVGPALRPPRRRRPSQAAPAPVGRRRPARCRARACRSSLLWVVAAGVAIVLRARAGCWPSPWPACRCCCRGGRAPGCPGTTTARRWRRSPSAARLAGLAPSPTRTDRWAQRLRAAWWGGPAARAGARQPAVAGGARVRTGCGRVAFGDDGRDVDGALALVPDRRGGQRRPARAARTSASGSTRTCTPSRSTEPEDFFAEGANPDLDALRRTRPSTS